MRQPTREELKEKVNSIRKDKDSLQQKVEEVLLSNSLETLEQIDGINIKLQREGDNVSIEVTDIHGNEIPTEDAIDFWILVKVLSVNVVSELFGIVVNNYKDEEDKDD